MDNTLPTNFSRRVRTQMLNLDEGDTSRIDLWQMLAELGNKLAQEHGFSAADLQGCSAYLNRTTEPLVRFLVWLQHTPEAHVVLREMGAWQEGSRESAEVALNCEQLPRAMACSKWPRRRKDSVA